MVDRIGTFCSVGRRNVDQCCIDVDMMEREKLRGLLALILLLVTGWKKNKVGVTETMSVESHLSTRSIHAWVHRLAC